MVNAVDRFVIYDDVNYIKQGWINRNRILVNGKDYKFTIQLSDHSSFKLIKDTLIHKKSYLIWKEKFYKTLEYSYKKSPQFIDIMPLLTNIIESEHENITALASNSIRRICQYLDIKTTIIPTAVIYNNSHLSAQDRVMDICLKEQASQYINVSGGMKLYSKDDFKNKGLKLSFIKSRDIRYKQFDNEFIPGLSIIDVMMFNDILQIKKFLNEYELI